MELDFNAETTTCITFIRVKVRLCFTDRLSCSCGSRYGFRGSGGWAESSSDSSDISSYSPISQPSPPASPASPALHDNEFNVPPLPTKSAFLRSTSPPDSSSEAQIRGKAKYVIGKSSKRKKDKKIDLNYEIGESSKRKKDKEIDLNSERNTRRCHNDHGVRFYPVDGQLP
ncbi:hypothetical protein ISN44_As09g002000 [Arabidopsis suecica]|uniref:Uncharacterized protein n=1 Tax=Arabidopsis suecica TaxID=45249 RepID=A0A8T2ACH9_ARASU|nr:hypothetical protein ISN44_As09g002000 [Arabidopsis suecica]